MKPSILLSVACALLLGACASMPIQNWPQNQRPPRANEARVIVTGGSPRACGGLRIFKIGVSRPGNYVVLNRVAEANIEGGMLKSHFADHYGRVNVISLEPGRYWIYPVADGALQNSGLPPSFEFEVAAGELAYVGELFVDAPCGSMAARIGLFDQQDRDVAVLVSLNPAFAGVPVVKRIAQPRQ
ncbi:MAG: hypothetical protein JWR84_248 [Caulobacter sp.]|nr:hypothetical protein [Caulobacter sp.]